MKRASIARHPPSNERDMGHGITNALSSTPLGRSRALDLASPAQLAKVYMGSRPSKASPSMPGSRGQTSREESLYPISVKVTYNVTGTKAFGKMVSSPLEDLLFRAWQEHRTLGFSPVLRMGLFSRHLQAHGKNAYLLGLKRRSSVLEVDKMVSPKKKSPSRLLPSMLRGPALKSLQNVEAPKFLDNLPEKKGNLPGSSHQKVETSRETGAREFMALNEKTGDAARDTSKADSSKDHETCVSGAYLPLTSSVEEHPPKKRAFQMIADEGSLDLFCMCLRVVVAQEDTKPAVTLQVNASNGAGRFIPETLFGIFFEEINHAGAGGLWAELVSNRGFEAGGQNTPSNIWPWSIVGDQSSIYVATDRSSCFERNKIALRMNVLCDSNGCPSGGVGVYNRGYWGMFGVQHIASTQQNASLFQASPGLEFQGGRSFSLGSTGGGDKSGRRIFKAKKTNRKR
ncbi:hypothetical protein F2Q69_00038823 [Brassica cretica]|uniref:Uncharacterized protein n=1 Tax=Brassica cretica TaxID=69181 RepID=A0A8S9STS9_BRACR|nr:hypothetical protein F2Q69_00038823 [Brassica cretica]